MWVLVSHKGGHELLGVRCGMESLAMRLRSLLRDEGLRRRFQGSFLGRKLSKVFVPASYVKLSG